MNLRRQRERLEDEILAPFAARSGRSKGRLRPERECTLRPAFQHDRDRILYSKAFRRLKHKTQVFLSPTGDHYRTRLTHTLEVAQIARTVARALKLNEDLTEAIALGHDLGHTPFGHAGEAVLDDLLPGGFNHHEQSLRVVDVLEKDGRGLNLTFEVRMGILHHSKGRGSFLVPKPGLSLEAQLVRVSDVMAYIAHDVEDAMRARIIESRHLPAVVRKVLGARLSGQINTMVRDLIAQSSAQPDGRLSLSPPVLGAMVELRDFLYENVYENPVVHGDFSKAERILRQLFSSLMADDDFYRHKAGLGQPPEEGERLRRAADYIAGMTDRYALTLYQEHCLPRPWAQH